MEYKTKILIIEDHDIIVWALKSMIEKSFSGSMLYTASGFVQGLEIAEKTELDLIVLDIDLPGGNTPRMISDLRNVRPWVKILVYTGLDKEDDSLEYLTVGANGILSKAAPFSTVADVMRLVLNGGRYLSPSVQNAITRKYLNNSWSSGPVAGRAQQGLTEREKDVVKLLLKGKWTKEIADELGLKLTTVSTHKGNIFEKLGVTNSIELFLKIQTEMPELLKPDRD